MGKSDVGRVNGEEIITLLPIGNSIGYLLDFIANINYE